MALSPDGAILAGYSRKPRQIRLWDVATGELLTTITSLRLSIDAWTGRSPVTVMAFSPDGQTLATASLGGLEERTGDEILPTLGQTARGKIMGPPKDYQIRLWDVATRQVIATLKRNTGRVTRVAYTPDNRTLATGRWDGTIQLWDTVNLQCTVNLTGHTSPVGLMTFSPDGRTLAGGGSGSGSHYAPRSALPRSDRTDNQNVRLWDLSTRQQIGDPLASHSSNVGIVMFSPDGQILATAGSTDSSARVWDSATGEHVATLGATSEVHSTTGFIRAMAFGLDGETVAAVTSDGIAHIWKIK